MTHLAGDDLINRIAFAATRVRPQIARQWLEMLGSERAFFEASESALAAISGRRSVRQSADARQRILEEARRECDFVMANGIRTSYFTDPDFPDGLQECDDAPLMLYSLGECDLRHANCLSIVGTRHATDYGIDFINSLIERIATRVAVPVTIVSGLAYGIDIAAHRAALSHGLPTAAILAHGLNTMYPATHRSVAVDMMRSGGMLLTDYRSTDAVHKSNFRERNRIVAGIAGQLLVAESDIRGGAMITATAAFQYSRQVFALPGRITDRYSRGCNKLIANQLAQSVADPDDIITQCGWPLKENAEAVQRSLFDNIEPHELEILNFLTAHGDQQINRLIVEFDRPVREMTITLMSMEERGLIRSLPGALYHAVAIT